MRLDEFFIPLAEGRREPVLMYHGTSDAILPSILTNGVQPFPAKRVWENDPDAAAHTMSRVSMGGSYWAGDFMLAYGSAFRAIAKLGGEERVVVAAQINEQSMLADEDSINGPLTSALAAVARHVGLSSSFDNMNHLTYYFFGKFVKEDKRNELVDVFREALTKYLREKHVLDRAQALAIIEAFIIRSLSYTDGWFRDRHLRDAGAEDLDVPTSQEAEKRCWAIRQQLTRTFRKTAYQTELDQNRVLTRMSQTSRIEQTIGYRGRNKILCVVSFVTEEWRTVGVKLHYGEVPEKMIAAYKSSVGEWPKLIDLRK